MSITDNYYSTLHKETIPKATEAGEKKIVKVGSEEIPNITLSEIELVLPKMKNRRAPGDVGVTNQMM